MTPSVSADRLHPNWPVWLILAAAVPLGAGAGLAWRAGAEAEAGLALDVLILGGTVAFGLLAMTRFWSFLLVMLAIRSGIDAFLPEAGGGPVEVEVQSGSLSPTVAVGVLFLAASWAWLGTQRSAGTMRPMSRPGWWGLGFTAVALIGIPISIAPSVTASSALKSLAIVTMFIVCEQLFAQDRRRIRPLLLVLFASLLIPLFLGLAQLSGAGFVDESIEVNRIYGSFVHPNTLATYAAIMLAYAAALRNAFTGAARIAVYASGAAAGTLLLFSYGRAAWIGGLIGLLVIGLLNDRRLLAWLGVGLVAVVMLVPSVVERVSDLNDESQIEGVAPNSFAWRLDYWDRVVQEADGREVLGLGLDTVPLIMDEQLQAHNSILQSFAELGVIGLVTLSGFVMSLVLMLRRALQRAAPGLQRLTVVGVAGASASVAAQLFSENLLTAVAPLWYVMAGLGFAAAIANAPDVEAEAAAETDPHPRLENASAR